MRLLNRSVGRLSRHRRRPLTGLVLLLAALLLTGGLYAVFAPASTADSAETEAEKAAKGRELFLISCSSCHGTNGEGLVTDDGQIIGPSLVGVGAAAVDFQVGTGRMPLAQPGAQAEEKDPQFDEDETEQLAAYVATLGPGPAIPSEEDYDPSTYATEQEREEAIALGSQLFLTNCTACHNFAGQGGAMPRGGNAPEINASPRHIYEAMLTGPQSMDVFSNGNISPQEKKAVIAYIESLQEQPGYGGFDLGSLGPVTEGLFGWIVGIGVLVGFAVWITAHSTRTKKKKGLAQ